MKVLQSIIPSTNGMKMKILSPITYFLFACLALFPSEMKANSLRDQYIPKESCTEKTAQFKNSDKIRYCVINNKIIRATKGPSSDGAYYVGDVIGTIGRQKYKSAEFGCVGTYCTISTAKIIEFVIENGSIIKYECEGNYE